VIFKHILALGLSLPTLLYGCADPTPALAHPMAARTLQPGEVFISTASGRKIGLEVQAARSRAVLARLQLTGKLAVIPEREVHVALLATGRVQRVYKRLGDHVKPGDLLAVLESSELGQAQSDFLQAEAQQRLKSSACMREQAMYERQYAAKKELLTAQSERTSADIEFERTRNKLLLLGSTPREIRHLATLRVVANRLELRASINGVVTSKSPSAGELCEAGSALFTLCDLSQLWVLADVHEQDLARVKPGASASLRALAYPGLPLHGTVASVSDALSTDTHTAKARILVANPGGCLKPEMYMTIALELPNARVLPAVPAGAVILAGKQRVVYVATGRETYRRRPVEVGAEADGWIALSKGLHAGESVVAKGALLVDASGQGE
jgi:cobalt-zinc-cadmium efflux system membrane fusion protein